MIDAPSILFIDLKTSGLYLRNEPLSSSQQPWAPYIAALQCDVNGRVVNQFATYIKADGRAVKNGALEKHGIDHKATNRVGIPESRALGILSDMLKLSPFDEPMRVVTYGDMDKMVIASLFARFAFSINRPADSFSRLWMDRPMTTFVNLQTPYAQRLCRIPPDVEDGDFKWPTFVEACQFALGRSATHENDSLEDMLLLKDLYFNFASRGYFAAQEAA